MGGPRNKLSDLNDHLFEQLERLNDLDLHGKELEEEVSRSNAIRGISSEIIKSGQLALKAGKMMDDRMNANYRLPRLLEGADDEK